MDNLRPRQTTNPEPKNPKPQNKNTIFEMDIYPDY